MSKIITLTDYYYLKTEIDEFLAQKASTSHTHGNITTNGSILNQANKNVVTNANGTIVTEDKPTIPTANSTATNIKMDGTQNAGSLATFAKADHVHPTDTSRAAASHTHDDRYYTESEINTKLSGKSDTIHNHDGTYLKSYTPPTGSTLQAGIVKLNSATNSTSTTEAATPSAVKSAYDLANNKTVTLTKLSTATTGYIATYEVKQGGTSLGKIDIPKDYLVKSGSVKTVSTANNPVSGYAVGDKYIDFIINTKDSSDTDEHIYINVKDLVDVYTHPNSGVTAGTNYNGNQTPAFGATFNIPKLTFNAQGHITASANSTVKIPNNLGNGTTAGLSTNDYTTTEKSKLAGIATGATKNTVSNSLTDTSTTNALSAAQGKELKTQIDNIISGETATDHNHDSRYYIESEIDTKLNSKVNTSDSRLTDARTPKFNQITATASNIQDLNNYKTGGFYYCNSDVNNAPYIIHCPWSNGTATPYTGNKSFFLLVETWGTTSTYVKQTLTYYNGNNTYARTCNNGTWTNWKEFNTNNNDYLRFATRVISGEAIAINNIICGSTDSKYYQLKSGKIIDIKYPILFNTSAITSGSYTDNVYSSHTGVPLTNNVSGKTVTSQKQVYIEGTSFDGKQFVVSDRVFVSDDQISNTTDLGKYYIYIGVSYSTTNIRFNSFHQTVYVETRNGLVPVGDNTHNPHILFKSDAGTAGYFKFLTIRTTGTYHDQTIEFDTTHRGNKPKTIVSFNFNTYEKTSGSKQYYTNIQAFYYHGHPTPVYYIQTNDGVQDATFDFYIRRETWDAMGVSDLRSSTDNYNGMTVTWHNEFVTALPTGTTQATLNPYYAQVSHTHGSISNNGQLNSDITSVNKVAVTDSSNNLKTINQLPYSKISGTPTIPTKTSQLTNDSNFTTATGHTHSNYLTSHNPVDTALSSTSTNAVQNKVINTALGNKVDKVSGKGLSTNDFTATYKTALDNLNTTIANAVSNLEMIEVVTSLPTSNIKTNKLYLKANSVNGSENKYDFYVRVNNAWEKVDSLDFSISDYIKKDSNTNLLLSNGTTKAQSSFIANSTGSVTSTHIADKTIVNGDIADATIETGKIKDSAITSAKIADGTIVNGDIANTTITGGKLVNGTITGTQLADKSVTDAKLANYEYINGTQTASTSAWTGVTTKLTSTTIPTGTIIYYRLNQSSTSTNVTLELKLSSDNTKTTGAKAVFLDDRRVTTHFRLGSIIPLRYDGTKWIVISPYTDNNTTYSKGNGLLLSGTTFSADFGTGTNQVARGDHTHKNLVKTEVTSGSLDTVTTTGWYSYNTTNSNSITNVPEKTGSVMEVLDDYGNGSYVIQKVYPFRSDKAQIIYYRVKFDTSGWSSWRRIDGGDKAPTSHAVNANTYGLGTASVYGHTKLSDNYTSSAGNASQGIGASSQAVKSVYDIANGKSTVSVQQTTSSGSNTYEIGKITINGTSTTLYGKDTVYTAPSAYLTSSVKEASALSKLGTSANATQATVNSAINTKIGNLTEGVGSWYQETTVGTNTKLYFNPYLGLVSLGYYNNSYTFTTGYNAIFTIPEQFRPIHQVNITGRFHDQHGYIDTEGIVRMNNNGASTRALGFSAIYVYRTEPP